MSHDAEFRSLLDRIEETQDTVQDEEVPLEQAQDTVEETLEAIDAFEDRLTEDHGSDM